jgi:uncharacterized protein DUF2019
LAKKWGWKVLFPEGIALNALLLLLEPTELNKGEEEALGRLRAEYEFRQGKTLEEIRSHPGGEGYQEHHFLENTKENQETLPKGFRDAPENKGNIPTFSHEDLHAEMSRKQDGLGGQTLRDSLRGKSVEDQLEAMFKLMKKLGILECRKKTPNDIATPRLISRYVSLLIEQYEIRNSVTTDGRFDVRLWNRLGDEIDSVFRLLEPRRDAMDALLSLLHHQNPNVRYSAALHLMGRHEKDVLPVLNEIAQETELPKYDGDVKGAVRRILEKRWISDRLLSPKRLATARVTKEQLRGMSAMQLVSRLVGLLLAQYAVRDRQDADARPDVESWNRLADQIGLVEHEIKSRGDDGIDALLPLIRHSNPNVRYVAAVQCLRQRTSQVLPVLEEMARTNDFRETKIDPESALTLWREGKWVVS